MDCIFCKIARNEILSKKIYEDEEIVKAKKKAPAVKDKAKQTAAEAKKDRTEQIKPPKTPGADTPKEKATTPQQITRIIA